MNREISHDEPPRAHIGLRVGRHTTTAGRIEFAALPEHRLKIHASAPVRESCGTQRFLYTRGDVDILPAGMACHWDEDDSSTSLLLQFAPSLLQRAAEDMGLDPDRAGLEPRYQLRDPRIEHIGWALDADGRAGAPGGTLYAESLGLALAAHLLGRYAAPRREPRQRGLPTMQLRRLVEFIDGALDKDLSLAQLARVAGVSASHLKTLFKRSTGVPVHEYVVQRRVERARALLVRGELPAAQVALEAGFAHQSHMARCMRRVLGVTPGALARAPA